LKSITAIYISHFFIISTNVHIVAGLIAVAIVLYCRSTPRRQSSFIRISFYNSTFIALIFKRSIAFYKSNIFLFEIYFFSDVYCSCYSVAMLYDPSIHHSNRTYFFFHLLGNFAFIVTMQHYNNSNKHLRIKRKIDSKKEIFDLQERDKLLNIEIVGAEL